MRSSLLLALLLGAAAPARAADAVLTQAQGLVLVLRSGESRFSPVQKGAGLSAGDTVQTSRGALAHLVFEDGAAMLLKERTSLTLGRGPRGSWAAVARGEFLAGLLKKLAPKTSFRVMTPTAVAAVRGTLFWGLCEDDGTTTFAALHDKVEVAAAGKTLVLAPGRKTVAAPGAPPSPAVPAGVPAAFPRTFSIDGSLEGLEALLPGDDGR